jgi:O-antigen ligase
MDAAWSIATPQGTSGGVLASYESADRGLDFAGGLFVATLVLLAAFINTRSDVALVSMYATCLLAALPYMGPFIGSLGRSPANVSLVLLFGTLALCTGAAYLRAPSPEVILQGKSLGATVVWASIYVVMFCSATTFTGVARLTEWIERAALLVTASVYLSVAAYTLDFRFGEVLEFSDGTYRAFGVLGDQVGFILVLSVLVSVVAARPVWFGVHLGALLLTATRGAFICLGIGLVAYVLALAFRRLQPTPRHLRWAAATAAVGLLLWLTPLSSVMANRFTDSSEAGVTLRLTAFEAGGLVVRDNPLMGVGFNGFANNRPALAEDWIAPETTRNGLARAANQYIQTATDGGIPALVLLVWFVLATCRNAIGAMQSSAAGSTLAAFPIWLIAVLIGNQGALWLLSNAASGFFVFAVAGVVARVALMQSSHQPVPWRVGALHGDRG